MKHGPRRFVATLGASAIALCASVALASPALANDIPVGDLQFSSSDTIYQLPDEDVPADGTRLSTDADQVTITGGNADITVTTVESESEAVVNEITIGSVETPYAGTVTFDNITTDHLDVNIEGGGEGLAVYFDSCHISNASIDVEGTGAGLMVVINDSMITGCSNGEALINVSAESTADLAISGSDLAGAKGGSGNFTTNGGPAIAAANEGTITFSGGSTVTGGAGASSASAPGAGGPGIYAPGSTLEMSDGTLLVKVGVDGGEVAMANRNVGLTVGTLDLSNGTGVDGQGPSITAMGWPQGTSVPLNLTEIKTGTPGSGDFYPWLLQASSDTETPGDNAWVVDFAGDGFQDEPVVRVGWTWFNIAPHEVTGLEATLWTNTEADTDMVWQVVNPMDGSAVPKFAFGVKPTFEGVDAYPYEAIDEATVSDLSFPEEALTPSGELGISEDQWLDDSYIVNPDYKGTELTITGTAELPESFTALYPDLDTSFETTFPVFSVKAVYRLYNEYTEQHLYTTDANEVRTDTEAGWTDEGAYWYSPSEPAGAEAIIQRLYNPYNGAHYYVDATDTAQIDRLVGLGWEKDSADADIVSLQPDTTYDGHVISMPVYTLYNRYSTVDTHLYTPDTNEVSVLTGLGWEENSTIIHAYDGNLIDPINP